MGNIGHYINGNNVEGKSGLNKPVFNLEPFSPILNQQENVNFLSESGVILPLLKYI